jgi:8-oxo-dGTP diphosphatase
MLEKWDLYSKDLIKTGRVMYRGDIIPNGYYHLVVEIWTISNDGHILLTQRHPTKTYPLLWECTGGSALQDEDSKTAAVRELKEETGLISENICKVYEYINADTFFDVWVNYVDNIDPSDISLQESEVVDSKIVTLQEFKKMLMENKIIRKLEYLIDLVNNQKVELKNA